MLSCHVASGNSFNASLFLFRDYPKEVDCRKPKQKERKTNEEKQKKVNTSWTSRRVLGGNGTRLLREEDIVEKIKINEVDLMIHDTYQTLRYVTCTCTIPSLTHRHPTFGFVFLASLTGFHPSTDIKL